MINRYLSRDIRDKIIDLLKNGGVDGQGNTVPSLSVALGDVDAKRGDTTPVPQTRNIVYSWGKNQKTPLIFVDMEESETEMSESEIGAGYEQALEVYKVAITATLQTANESDLQNYIENYLEAIIEVLHNYCDDNITWILLTETERSPLYSDENQTMKMATCGFEIRIN